MKRYVPWTIAAAAVFALGFFAAREVHGQKEQASEPAPQRELLAHDIYFSLKDNSPASREKLIAACKKYLAPHPGIEYFAVGTPAEVQGAFNVKDFDVALHMVFRDRAALAKYAKTEEHQKFLVEGALVLKGVRIFDSMVERVSVPDDKK